MTFGVELAAGRRSSPARKTAGSGQNMYVRMENTEATSWERNGLGWPGYHMHVFRRVRTLKPADRPQNTKVYEFVSSCEQDDQTVTRIRY